MYTCLEEVEWYGFHITVRLLNTSINVDENLHMIMIMVYRTNTNQCRESMARFHNE